MTGYGDTPKENNGDTQPQYGPAEHESQSDQPEPVGGTDPARQPAEPSEHYGATDANIKAVLGEEVPAETESEPKPLPDAPEGDLVDSEELAAAISAALAEQFEGLDRKLSQVQRLVREKDETIATLYDELQDARKGVDLAILRPVFTQFVRILETIDGDIEIAKAAEEERLAQRLDVYRTAISNGLLDCGLEEEPATDLTEQPKADTKSQEIRKVIDADPELHQHVERVVMPAYSFNGKRIIRERVDVYRRRQVQAAPNG